MNYSNKKAEDIKKEISKLKKQENAKEKELTRLQNEKKHLEGKKENLLEKFSSDDILKLDDSYNITYEKTKNDLNATKREIDEIEKELYGTFNKEGIIPRINKLENQLRDRISPKAKADAEVYTAQKGDEKIEELEDTIGYHLSKNNISYDSLELTALARKVIENHIDSNFEKDYGNCIKEVLKREFNIYVESILPLSFEDKEKESEQQINENTDISKEHLFDKKGQKEVKIKIQVSDIKEELKKEEDSTSKRETLKDGIEHLLEDNGENKPGKKRLTYNGLNKKTFIKKYVWKNLEDYIKKEQLYNSFESFLTNCVNK